MNRVEKIIPEQMYTSEEVTDYLSVSLRTTQRILKSGELPSFKIQGQYRIKGLDLLNYLQGVRIDSHEVTSDEEDGNKPANLVSLLEVSPIEVLVSSFLAENMETNKKAFLDKNNELRKKITLELGFICPGIRFADEISLKDKSFFIMINGVKVFESEAENYETLIAQTETIIKKYAHEILSREEVFVIIEKLKKSYPVVVDEVLGDEVNTEHKINIGQLTKILKELLREQVSIRNMRVILEALADYLPYIKNTEDLVSNIRETLSGQICANFTQKGLMEVITISEKIEEYLFQNLKKDFMGFQSLQGISDFSKKFQQELAKIINKKDKVVIICKPEIRKALRQVLERNFYNVTVLSYREISKEVTVKEVKHIDIIS
jgi:flagellar biosynthesis protein FlhA